MYLRTIILSLNLSFCCRIIDMEQSFKYLGSTFNYVFNL